MKPMNRLFCALLAAVLLIGACSAFAETAPAVFLPESTLRLKLPEKTVNKRCQRLLAKCRTILSDGEML